MSENEYLRKRIQSLEITVRSLMAIVVDTLPPVAANDINRLTWEQDKALDELDAEFKAESASNENGQRGSEA
jgi:hypothetical protein